MIRRPPRSTQSRSSAASDVYKRQILMGPSGTGKTFIAAGLCYEALLKGYKACFRSMEQLIHLLKMKDITKSAAREYMILLNADLLVIDDIMMFPIERKQSVTLFNLSL